MAATVIEISIPKKELEKSVYQKRAELLYEIQMLEQTIKTAQERIKCIKIDLEALEQQPLVYLRQAERLKQIREEMNRATENWAIKYDHKNLFKEIPKIPF